MVKKIMNKIKNSLKNCCLRTRGRLRGFIDCKSGSIYIKREKLSPFFSKGFQSVDIEWRRVKADYVILDIKRPWFINDQGCKWLYSECTDKETAAEYLEWISKSRKLMNIIFEKELEEEVFVEPSTQFKKLFQHF